MIDIEKELSKVKDPNHYLLIGLKNHPPYHEDFKRALSFLLPKLSDKQTERLLFEKLQISERTFAEKPFCQSACETTVCASFADKYSSSFKYEVRLNPSNTKDVECQFEDAGFRYNIEVKCPDFGAREAVTTQNAFKFSSMGRIPDYQEDITELTALLNEAKQKSGGEIKPFLNVKNMDNNLKDFLYSAHEKFSPSPLENEVNVLFVGCDDAMDIQSWWYNLYTDQGFFTPNSFADIEQYRRVDLVILTNLYHRHYQYFRKTRLSDFWKLDGTFSLIFCNPFRLAEKKSPILHFGNLFNNHSKELVNYRVEGSAPEDVKDSLRILHFVKDELETKRGIFYFEPEKKIS